MKQFMLRLGAATMLWIVLGAASVRTAFAQDGILSTAAGTGEWGSGGDGGPAINATFALVTGVAVGSDRTVYVADAINSVVRRVAPDGAISTFCGQVGSNGYAGDGGPADAATVNAPDDVAVDASGNVFLSDVGNNVVRRVDAASGIVTTFAGTGEAGFTDYAGNATELALNLPAGLAVDASGNLYIASAMNGLVHRVTPAGELTTVAGRIESSGGSSGDGGLAVDAGLNRPCDVAVALDGTMYIAEQWGHRIRKVSPDGVITTYAGTGATGYSGDGGAATDAQFNFDVEYSNKIALDASGNLYVADGGNSVIRRISPACCIETVAGNGVFGFGGDGKWAFEGQLAVPYGVACLASGGLVIADSYNFRIREVDLDFEATTGANVAVIIGSEAALTFNEVSSTGTVTVDVRQAYEPPVAGDLQLGSEYIDINTSAVFTGTVDITLPFDDPDPTDPPDEVVTWDLAQRVLHFTDGAWQDATKEIHPESNEIVAEVASLSPFAVVKVWPSYQPVNFRRGDVNNDGGDDVSDAVRILFYLFVSGVTVSCADAADLNDDGKVNISDAVALVVWIFLRGEVPPAPGPFGVGIDMTDDSLGCVSYP